MRGERKLDTLVSDPPPILMKKEIFVGVLRKTAPYL